ncbi:MAG: hypothetical protein ACR2PS_15430 [Pseudomonadales bacterium]
MRSISVQVQPERSPGIDMSVVDAEFEAIASNTEMVAHHSFSSGSDHGAYFNYTFGAKRPRKLWQEIKTRLYQNQLTAPHMKRASMAMCSNENGWDDYLQLFHFDPTVKLDSTDGLPE